ncbi:radical SAM protein, partial [Candidatus Magnetomorum sp. HK-1]
MVYSTAWKPNAAKNNNHALILACFDSRLSEYNKYYSELQKGLETGLACIERNMTLEILENINQDNSNNLSISYPFQLVGFILGTEFKRHDIAFRIVTGASYDDFLNENIYDYIRKEKYSHIFFSTTYIHSFTRLKYIATNLRRLFPASKIVAGGQLLNYNKRMLECPNIDFYVIGDGEETAVNILLSPEKYVSSLNSHGTKRFVVEAPMKDLNMYQTVDYELVWDCIPYNEREIFKEKYYFPMETVRGCYFKCAFCSSSTLQGDT